MVQNLMIATQALGIGGYPFSGGKGRVTLGGERHWHEIGGEGPCGSLGFACPTTRRWARRGDPVGLEGIFEGACPPFHADMDAAVDFVLDLRYGGTRHLLGARGGTLPWRADLRAEVPRPSAEAIACTKTWCRYIWDTYGRFPATIDPLLMTVWYQAAPPRHRLLRPLLPARGRSRARARPHGRVAWSLGTGALCTVQADGP